MKQFTLPLSYRKGLKSLLSISLVSSLLFASCEKADADNYIIIKDDNGNEIVGDTVFVPINSYTQTLIDVSHSSSTVYYLRQIDGGEINTLQSYDGCEVISDGNSGGKWYEKTVITTSFADSLVNVGSIVKISARVKTDMVASAYYQVTE